jgi:putative MATE family efflux protein
MEISSYKNVWRVAYPIIAGSIAQNLINVVDTAFLGRLGPIQLGAAGNAMLFYFVFIVIGIGFSIGGEIIVGRRNGEGNYKAIGPIIDHCFYALIPLSIFLFFLIRIFADDILQLVTADSELVNYGSKYIHYRAFGIFFAFANISFRTFYIGTTNTSILIWSTSLMAAVNIIFDYLLIFGEFGFPEMGVEGAAIASVIAEISALVYFLTHTLLKTDLNKYALLRFAPFSKDQLKNLIKVGSPIMLQHFIAISSWLFFFLIIEKMGSDELAISHIIRSIYMVLMIPLFGFSAATSTLVSNLIGMNRQKEVMGFTWKVAKLTLLATAVVIPFNLFFPEYMLSFFTDNTTIIEGSIPVLYVITGSMLVFSLAYILFSAVSGTGNTQISLLIEVSTLVIYIVAAYLIAVQFEATLPAVWCSEFIYFGFMGLLAFLYLRLGKWQSRVI